MRTRHAALAALFCLALTPALAADSPQTAPAGATEEVGIITTDLGQIVIRFFPDSAPNHVDNFKALARSKFYDGTTFHRVAPGFVIQGGDPNSKDADPANDGIGDGPRRLKAEFNSRPHVRGAVSMARSSDPNSASCQFFIVIGEARSLNGKYSLFGEVIEGMDTVDKIVAGAAPTGDRPAKPVVMRKVRIEARPRVGA